MPAGLDRPAIACVKFNKKEKLNDTQTVGTIQRSMPLIAWLQETERTDHTHRHT